MKACGANHNGHTGFGIGDSTGFGSPNARQTLRAIGSESATSSVPNGRMRTATSATTDR